MPRTVSEAMTREVMSVHPDTPFKQLAQTLVEHRIDGLPVVDEKGVLLGVVSGSDLTCHEEPEPSLVSLVRGGRTARTHAKKARGRTARDLMTAPARTVHPGAGICDALAQMGRAKVGRLVVVEDGRVVGMLTRTDVLRIFTRSDDELTREVEPKVRAALSGVPHDVRVAVGDGVVYLRGDVERASRACGAVNAAREVPGVVDVEDEMHAEIDDLAVLAGVPGV